MNAKEVPWRKAAPSPVVLIFGPQEYLATRTVKALREQLTQKLGNLDVVRVSAADYGAGQLASFGAPSLFAEPKCIIIDGVEKCSDDLIVDGIAYLSKPEADVTLILLHDGSSVRGKKLLEAIRASAIATEISVPKFKDQDREAFVVAEFQAANRQVQPQAARALAAAFGDSLAELAAACEQLMQDSAETISEALVDQYYGGRIEVTYYKIMDAALAGRKVQALEYLRHALQSGADKVSLVQGFAKQARELAQFFGNKNPGSMRLEPWKPAKLHGQLQGWTEDGLAKVITSLAEADAATKGASRDPEYVLEQFVLLLINKGK